MKKYVALFFVLLVGLLAVGCSQSVAEPTDIPTETSEDSGEIASEPVDDIGEEEFEDALVAEDDDVDLGDFI